MECSELNVKIFLKKREKKEKGIKILKGFRGDFGWFLYKFCDNEEKVLLIC